MTNPPPGAGRRAGGNFKSSKSALHSSYHQPSVSSSRAPLSPCAVTSSQRLRRYRQAIDAWDAMCGSLPMPQPANYGLRLRTIRPSEVYWTMPA